MGNQLTIRLPGDLAQELERKAQKLKKGRSEVIREALRRFFNAERTAVGSAERPYDRVQDLIGIYRSGVPDLGLRHREYLLKQLRRGR